MVNLSKYFASISLLAILATACTTSMGHAQAVPQVQTAPQAGDRGYEVLSVKADEMLVRITPKYESKIVHEATSGKALSAITFAGSATFDTVGAPNLPRMILSFLTPDRSPASFEVVSQLLEVLPNTDLAPVPTYEMKDGAYQKHYVVNPDRYTSSANSQPITIGPTTTFRTVFSGQVVVTPVQYDAFSHSVVRVKTMTLRIRLPHAAALAGVANIPVSASEADLYRGMFINGGESQFYGLAAADRKLQTQKFIQGSAGNGTWLQLETNDEGVYRLTAQNLADAGITGAVDPNSIELFGIGGELLNEGITDSSGEWIERPIEIKMNGASFSELYFYARGVVVWKYSHQSAGVDGLFHRINPYTSTGHFLLKVGGDQIGHHLRVPAIPDAITATPQAATNRVFTAVVHEVERTLEGSNFGREMVESGIPREDVGPITFNLPAPGYTADSTTLRVGYDASIASDYSNPDSGFVTVRVGGQLVGTIKARADSPGTLMRNWDNALPVRVGSASPLSVGITFTSSNVTATAFLDFAELMYRRTTDLAAGSIPFMLLDTKQAFQYNFTNAGSGEVWDVTKANPVNVAAPALGSNMSTTLQGDTLNLRRFVAFTPQTALAARITSLTTAPSLRSTICTTGATEIMIAPQDFLDAANNLKQIREKGGQATEPITSAVVNIEDIYREFGYGNRDVSAIRDFMAYTFRHVQDPSRRPLYLLLLGGGHCDFQNRQTTIPNRIPPFEWPESEYLGTYRENIPTAFPDDSYFGRLQSTSDGSGRSIDVAVGRVSATSVQDAEAFVAKTQEYEHASDTGAWRTVSTFLADDRIGDDAKSEDQLDHLGETEGEVRQVPDWVLVKKIYEVSYPTVFTSSGRKKPTCEKAIIDAMNNGTVLFSFIGHGNPSVWTHESILNVPSTINRFNNFDKLAYVTTATCDFSVYDNFAEVSGGELFILKPDGGAIGMLGTSRSVTEEPELTAVFYGTLLNVDPTIGYGTTSVGTAFLAGKRNCLSGNLPYFYLLGDPAQRLLVPKLFVNFDSINGQLVTDARVKVPALSQVQISGSVGQGVGSAIQAVQSFNGMVTLTLYDTRTRVTATTVFPSDTVQDAYVVDGPVLYRGSAVVRGGRFTIDFIVPKDVKLDTASAKIMAYAFADDTRTASGTCRSVQLVGSDPNQQIVDTTGPSLSVYLGSRAFHSGDAVSKHSTAIVDVSDLHGLNTSTASVGHSFIAWVDDAQDASVDMASTFVAKQGDFTSGTSEHAIELPAGHHTLHVRAFDVFDNPSFASVDFVAKNEAPYQLYNVTSSPNPLLDHTLFSLVQPGQAGNLVDITITVYTVDGRRERTLSTQTRESAVDILWDGRDDVGNSVANGVYVFTVTAHNLDDGTTSLSQGKCIVAR